MKENAGWGPLAIEKEDLMARLPIAIVFLVLGGGAGALVTTSAMHQGQAPAPVFPKEFSSYREVVKVVLPAVVSVRGVPKAVSQKAQPNTPRRRTIPGIPEEFRRFF